MVSMLAALSCVFSGCAARPQLAEGSWSIHVQVGETDCSGVLELRPSADGQVTGSLSLCEGRFGPVTGTLRSNELVLDFSPQGEPEKKFTVRASVVGNYLSGDLDDGLVEGWRGDPPVADPAPASGGESEDDSDSEFV